MIWNLGYHLGGAPDRLPIPPVQFVRDVIITGELAWFFRSGLICRQCIQYALLKNGYRIENFDSVLDFGCGCGRVLRWWKDLDRVSLSGADRNPELIRWCQKNLSSLAEFTINPSEPPTSYIDNSFDFIYAISVFTHLCEPDQQLWMQELWRLLRPHGVLLVSLHGVSSLGALTPAEQGQFRNGQLVIRNESASGGNDCGAYHPPEYVFNCMVGNFEILDYLPQGSRDMDQDFYLLAKH